MKTAGEGEGLISEMGEVVKTSLDRASRIGRLEMLICHLAFLAGEFRRIGLEADADTLIALGHDLTRREVGGR